MYDLIIIGGGPAGITAGIYAAGYNLKTLILTKELGGWLIKTKKICNYPGYNQITGLNLASKFKKQLEHLDIEVKIAKVENIEKQKNFKITTDKGKYESKTIFLSMGTEHKKLKIRGEEKFLGRGVSYCATCDAPFFKNKVVGVVGGGDSACMTALILSEYAKKVYLVYRKGELKVKPAEKKLIEEKKKIEVIYNTDIKEIIGNKFLKKVKLSNDRELNMDGLFIGVGTQIKAISP